MRSLICIGLRLAPQTTAGCDCTGSAIAVRCQRSKEHWGPALRRPTSTKNSVQGLGSWSPRHPKEEVAERSWSFWRFPGIHGKSPSCLTSARCALPAACAPSLPQGLQEPSWNPYRRLPWLSICLPGAHTHAHLPGSLVGPYRAGHVV